jgi:hypothetical protein
LLTVLRHADKRTAHAENTQISTIKLCAHPLKNMLEIHPANAGKSTGNKPAFFMA